MTDSLSRLRVGLDRDEAIARAAADRSGEWREFDNIVWGEPFHPGDPEQLLPEGGDNLIVYNEGYPLKAEARHIARQHPSRVLRQAEKLREAAGILDSAVNGSGPEPDLLSVCAELSEILAGIYPEGTTETGDTKL